jgi:hypothetical protein
MIYQPRRSSVRAFFILIAFVLVSMIGLYMFLVSNGHTTAQDQQRNAQPVAGSAPHILITEYAVRELDKVPADVPFVQSLNAPSTYELISLHQGNDLLPNATHLVSFESYQAIANAFKQKAIPADARVVLYDNERWLGTPVVEQQQPFGYVQKAAELVHQHGLLFANSPAPDLNTTLAGNKQYNNYNGYLHLHLATLAKYADIFDIQAQRSGSVSAYVSFANAAYAQARAVNKTAVILLGVTTADNQTSQDIIDDIRQTRGMVDGYWLNVINGPSVLNPVIQKWPSAGLY